MTENEMNTKRKHETIPVIWKEYSLRRPNVLIEINYVSMKTKVVDVEEAIGGNSGINDFISPCLSF